MSGKLLCEKLAREHDLPEAFARKILFELLIGIESIVAETGRCQIRGFGTFKLKTFAARRSHDYVSRTIIQIPEKTKLVFEHGQDRAPLFLNKNHAKKDPQKDGR